MTKRILSYDEFKQAVVDGINEELSDMGSYLTASLRMVPKVNGFRESLNIEDENSDAQYSPNFYIMDYFETYNSGMSLEGIIRKIINTYLDVEAWKLFGDTDYSEPENADRVVYMLVNREENKEILEMIPHRDFLDLAVIYRVIICIEGKNLFSYILNNSILEKWGMSEEDIFERAKLQTDVILEPRDSVDNEFGILTNRLAVNGSGVLLSEERLKKVSDELDDDIYLIPSSINEFFCMPVKAACAEALKSSIRDSVKTGIVEPEEWLSFNLYRFSRDTGKVSIV